MIRFHLTCLSRMRQVITDVIGTETLNIALKPQHQYRNLNTNFCSSEWKRLSDVTFFHCTVIYVSNIISVLMHAQ